MTDPEITLTAESYEVSASETVSTGDYENYVAETTVSGEIGGVDELDEEMRRLLRRQLFVLHRDLQRVVQRAGENRISIRDAEDWSDPDRRDS